MQARHPTTLAVAMALVASALVAAALSAATAGAAGGLSVTPVVLEATATPGRVGSITIANTSPNAMQVRVRARPWRQPRSGRVIADTRRTLAQVRLGAGSFMLAAGTRRALDVGLIGLAPGGSLYGSIEVIGTPTGQARPKSVRTRYRLIAALRLNPPAAKRVLRLQVGRILSRGRRTVVALRNTGNTVTPVGGSIRIVSGAGVVRTTIAEARILPGATVDVSLRSGALPAGRHVADVTLRQGRTIVTKVKRSFRVR